MPDGWLDWVRGWAVAHAPNAVRIVLTPLVAYLLIKALGRLIARLEQLADDDDPTTLSEREKRARTLGRMLRQIVAVLVWAIAAMLVLRDLGVDIAPILAGAGIVGLAVGFGAQTLVKDVISGFFLLLENQYRVHDDVAIAGVRGNVEAITLRTTVLRDFEGRVHIVPNGTIGVVTNHTRGWSCAVLDVPVPYEEDSDRCAAVLRSVGAELEADPEYGGRLEGPFEVLGVEALADSSLLLRVAVRTRPEERVIVLRELRRRVKQALAREGIEIPYPHRTVTFGAPPPGDGIPPPSRPR